MTEIADEREARFDELVCCSLEPWDEVWRRNQFLVDELLSRNASLRVLFVEPVIDIPYDLAKGRWPRRGGLHDVRGDGRVYAMAPHKLVPRVLAGRFVQDLIILEVTAQLKRIGFSHPVLWVNDDSYAVWAKRVPWPVLHDITDDWLAASATPRELARRRHYEEILKSRADVRVAVSQHLVDRRGSSESIQLIPDAVDVEHFHIARDRPSDVPSGPFVAYVGTLHEDRIDLGLVTDLARTISPVPVVLIGPNAMTPASTRILTALSNCLLLGPRPYADVPAYYQHADVIVVPHRVSDFTESLDPIKIYECLAVGRPTVATPVAGFRGQAPPIVVADASEFPAVVAGLLSSPHPSMPGSPPTWALRAEAFEEALVTAMRVRTESARAK